nr:hypothetical protein [Singulisphaera acidiphila]
MLSELREHGEAGGLPFEPIAEQQGQILTDRLVHLLAILGVRRIHSDDRIIPV